MTPKVGSNGINALKRAQNPYKEKADFRVQCDVSTEDASLLRSIFPLGGFERKMMSTFYMFFLTQLKQNGITSYSPDNQRRAEELLIRYTTAIQTPGTGSQLHDSGTADRVQQPSESTENQPTNPSQTTQGRRGDGRGKLIRERNEEIKKRTKAEDKS